MNSGSFEVIRRIREREKEGMGGPSTGRARPKTRDPIKRKHCTASLHCSVLNLHCFTALFIALLFALIKRKHCTASPHCSCTVLNLHCFTDCIVHCTIQIASMHCKLLALNCNAVVQSLHCIRLHFLNWKRVCCCSVIVCSVQCAVLQCYSVHIVPTFQCALRSVVLQRYSVAVQCSVAGWR